MSTVVRAEHLGKKYVIRHNSSERAETFRDAITKTAKGILKRSRVTSEEFWALNDVNFSIHQGDRVGIIGRNGAGKSTLLKVLSRITEPTRGKVLLKGRVASLLEVGTGFHPELSGRENIFLNGAVLGMSRFEINRKFDEIVAFAEVEKFLDTPVKRYSSGMYVRLAFSVAAHLEPEILVVDEVLAVGDAQFQKKCLGKMEDVGKEGRTILFVSHNMSVIGSLCNRSILLEKGGITYDGNTSDAIKRYYVGNQVGGHRINFEDKLVGNSECRLLTVATMSASSLTDTFDINEDFYIESTFELSSSNRSKYVVNLHFTGPSGEYLFVSNQPNVQPREQGLYKAKCKVPARLLNCGVYFIGVAVTKYLDVGYDVCFFEPGAVTINMVENIERTVDRYNYGNEVPGLIRPLLDWKEERI